MPTGKYAVVRGIASTYAECIRPSESEGEIDLELARDQHTHYCEALETLGLRIIGLNPDDRFPDCCFVEDTAIVIEDKAIIARMAPESRRGEEVEVKQALEDRKELIEIHQPGTIDGGDVLVIGSTIFIGLGLRTNHAAIEQVQEAISDRRYEIIPVELSDILHLKSACTYVGNNCVLLLPGHFDPRVLKGCDIIEIPVSEAYAANCLSVNGRVLISRGYPRTRSLIEARGFETIELGMTEFRKGGGSLTCLSIIL